MNDNVEILRRYNRWRRGQALWNATADLPDPRVVGEAIDSACDEIERLRVQVSALEAEREDLRWRDVADELPREAQEVLFVRGEKTVFGAWIGGIFWHNNQKMAAAYWMPIPKAPKTGECIDAALAGGE